MHDIRGSNTNLKVIRGDREKTGRNGWGWGTASLWDAGAIRPSREQEVPDTKVFTALRLQLKRFPEQLKIPKTWKEIEMQEKALIVAKLKQ